MWAGLVPPEPLSLALQMAPSPCLHIVSSHEDPSHSGLGPIHTIPLITSLKVLSPITGTFCDTLNLTGDTIQPILLPPEFMCFLHKKQIHTIPAASASVYSSISSNPRSIDIPPNQGQVRRAVIHPEADSSPAVGLGARQGICFHTHGEGRQAQGRQARPGLRETLWR